MQRLSFACFTALPVTATLLLSAILVDVKCIHITACVGGQTRASRNGFSPSSMVLGVARLAQLYLADPLHPLSYFSLNLHFNRFMTLNMCLPFAKPLLKKLTDVLQFIQLPHILFPYLVLFKLSCKNVILCLLYISRILVQNLSRLYIFIELHVFVNLQWLLKSGSLSYFSELTWLFWRLCFFIKLWITLLIFAKSPNGTLIGQHVTNQLAEFFCSSQIVAMTKHGEAL